MDAELIILLKYSHATFNALVFFLCCLQGLLGWRIRHLRQTGAAPIPQIIKSHRKIGPILTALGILGVFGGLILGFTLHQFPVTYNPYVRIHLSIALILGPLLVCTFFSSKQIKSINSTWRSYHALLGLVVFCFYCLQVTLGLLVLTYTI